MHLHLQMLVHLHLQMLDKYIKIWKWTSGNFFDIRDSLLPPKRAQRERFKFFADVIDKIYSGVGPVQRQRLSVAVKQAYANSELLGNSAPTINDVLAAYKLEDPKVDSLHSIMQDLVDDQNFVDNQQKRYLFRNLYPGSLYLIWQVLDKMTNLKIC